MVVDVTGKVVVITGSSRGIGRELAKAYAKEKAKVVINYHKSEKQAKELYPANVSSDSEVFSACGCTH